MVFDLDPGEGTSIVECCEVAGYVMDELAEQGTESFAKTSGSKGLQLYAAVGPKTTWDSLRDRAHEIARKLESDHRELVVSNMRKSLRRGRVLIDWSQNHSAKTTVAVYSVRAMPTPTVSTPVTSAEVHAVRRQERSTDPSFRDRRRAAANRQGRRSLRAPRPCPERAIHTGGGKPVEDGFPCVGLRQSRLVASFCGTIR